MPGILHHQRLATALSRIDRSSGYGRDDALRRYLVNRTRIATDYVNIFRSIYGDSTSGKKCAVAGTGQRGDNAIGRNFSNRGVPVIADVNIARGCDRDPVGFIETGRDPGAILTASARNSRQGADDIARRRRRLRHHRGLGSGAGHGPADVGNDRPETVARKVCGGRSHDQLGGGGSRALASIGQV